MIKKGIIYIVSFILGVSIGYFFMVFIELELDLTLWPGHVRGGMLFISIASVTIGLLFAAAINGDLDN